MSKQKTIGNNPLAAYLSVESNVNLSEHIAHENSEILAQNLNTKKQRITIHVSSEIIERVKNAVFWEPGLTLAGFAEYALEKAITEFETERGTPFPQRKHPLRGGRPLK